MCGIVGYIRERNAVSVLIDGLKRLEYRGYDSAGIAFYENGNNNIALRKTVGKLVNLESILNGCEYESHLYWSYKVGNTRKTQ